MPDKGFRVNVTFPKEWKPVLEEYLKKKGYTSMSEMIRDLVRKHLIEKQGGN